MKVYPGTVRLNTTEGCVENQFWREAEQLSWGSGVTGEMDALERMPSFLGLPILERSASLFFPRSSLSFFLYIFQLLAKESIRWETADKCHICMFKVTWAEPCFEKSPPPFDVEKLCWCNNIKACNWYYAKHWNGMFCQKKRVNEGIIAL